MATVFIPAKKATRTTLSGLGGVSSSSIFMPTVRGKAIKRGMGADIFSAALNRPMGGLGVDQLISAKFAPIRANITPVDTSGGSTTTWVLVGVGLLLAVGGLVYVSTKRK